jgi:hypothetical protein
MSSALDFYKEHPCEAAEELLGLILSDHQRVGLLQLWNHPLPALNWSRGMSKTFIAALYFLIRGILFKGVKIGLIAPSFRQEKEILEKMNEIREIASERGYPLLEKSIKKFVVGSNDAYIRFTNGSRIECVPIGGSQKGGTSRGKRFHIVFVDEYAFLDESIITRTAKPFLNVKSRNPIKYGEHYQNQLIIASSSWFRENHFYKMIESYEEAIAQGSTRHVISQFNILDFKPTSDYNLDWDSITENMRTMPRADFSMEYLNEFPSMSTPILGIKSIRMMFDSIRTEQIQVETHAESGHEYIIACDPAEVMGGDNACVVVLKLYKDSSRRPSFCVPVKVMAWNDGKSMEDVADVLKDEFVKFKPILMMVDTRGGGAEVIKQLAKGDDIKIVDMSLRNIVSGDRVFPVLMPIVFSSKVNSEMLGNALIMIERGRVRFPKPVLMHDVKEIEDIHKELKYLKTEIMGLRPKQSGASHIWVSSDKKRSKKDRAVSFIMVVSEAYKKWFLPYENNRRRDSRPKPRFGRINLTGMHRV